VINHDTKGRFKTGNTASAKVSNGKVGRPAKKREERFYGITLRACTFKDWREIIKKAVEQAKAGDTAARKFLADYLMGPPAVRLADAEGGILSVTLLTGNIDPDKL